MTRRAGINSQLTSVDVSVTRNLPHRTLAAEVAKHDGSTAGSSWGRVHSQETCALLLPRWQSVTASGYRERMGGSDSLGNVPWPASRQTQHPESKPQ